MTQTLSQKLRQNKTTRRTRRDAAAHIEELQLAHTELTEAYGALQRVVEAQQKIMDMAASIMVDALGSAGINKQNAAACVNVIRGVLHKVGLTTHEAMVTMLLERIAITAGLPAGAQFDPVHVLDQIRVTLAAQSRNGEYLEWALERLFDPGTDTQPPTLITAAVPASPGALRSFAIDTTWMQAIDEMRRPPAAAEAPAAELAPEPA